ncbi:MAG: serine protease, partial [Nitrosomonadales bacterium]
SAAISVHAKTASEIYELASKITVVVKSAYDEKETIRQGSGVILSEEEVVTNCHVINGASQIKVLIVDEVHSATLQYSDWDRDICSLRVKGLRGQVAVIGNSKTLEIGAKVYAVGAPHGLELTISDGIVSNLREFEGGDNYIQTTAAISPGSSGSGLFDENGALVGIMSFNYSKGQNLNFASRVEWVKELPARSVKAVPTPSAESENETLSRTIERESISDVEIVRSDFGLFGSIPSGDPAFQASRMVPLEEGQGYGWFIELKTSKPKIKWREEFVMPISPATMEAQGSTVKYSLSKDGLTVTTEQEGVVPDSGLIYNVWGVAAGDPKGHHIMRVYVEDKLVRTFEFEVEE